MAQPSARSLRCRQRITRTRCTTPTLNFASHLRLRKFLLRRPSPIQSRCRCARRCPTVLPPPSCAQKKVSSASVPTRVAASKSRPASFAALPTAASTSRKKTLAVWPRYKLTSRPVSARKICMSPRCMMPQRWAKSCRSKISASYPSDRAVLLRNVESSL